MKSDLDVFKEKYTFSIEQKGSKIEDNEERIKHLELELAKANSKLDENYLQLNELKMKYAYQSKAVNKKKNLKLKNNTVKLKIWYSFKEWKFAKEMPKPRWWYRRAQI